MSTTIDEENRRAKLGLIKVFFKCLEDRIAAAEKLYDLGYCSEAKLLCVCCIDVLASNLYRSEERNNYNFVRILVEHGGEEIFPYIHPRMLEDALSEISEKRGQKWEIIKNKVVPTLRESRGRFYSKDEIIEMLSPLVTKDELEKIKKELWRGTYAAIIYRDVRIPTVHGIGTADGITFDKVTYNKGKRVPPIDFPMLLKCLKRIKRKVEDILLAKEELALLERLRN